MLFIENISSPGARHASESATRCVAPGPEHPPLEQQPHDRFRQRQRQRRGDQVGKGQMPESLPQGVPELRILFAGREARKRR